MFKELAEIAPTSVLFALMLWAGLSYFITAPEISERIAMADFAPACKRAIATDAANEEKKTLGQYDNNDVDRRQAVQGLGSFNKLLNNSFGDRSYSAFIDKYGTNPFDVLTGGALSRSTEMLQQKLDTQRRVAQERARLNKEKVLSTANDQCSCRAKLAFLESRTDWALYTGTLGIIEPEAVENFGSHMAIQARVCAQRVG